MNQQDPADIPAPQGQQSRPREDASEAPEEVATPGEDRIGALGTSLPPQQTPSGGPLVGTRWSDQPLPQRNRLLAGLPPESFEQVRRRLAPVELGLKEILWEKDEPIQYVYFPESGVISMIAIMQDGSSVEVGTVGNEGLLGVPVVLGVARSPLRAFSQVPGCALRMTAEDLRQALNEDGPLRERVWRYTQALFTMLAQASACHRAHSARQRLALWLLLCLDRVGVDTFPITQEFLAQMMGVRRATVSEEAGRLQRSGIIGYRQGIVTIRDRRALEAVACECYRVIRDEYDRLLGPAPGGTA